MEYTKTNFLNNYFKKLISEDDFQSRYSQKVDYSFEVENMEVTDIISKVKDDLNKVNKEINLEHEYSELDAIQLIKNCIKENFYGKMVVEIPIIKMYQHLVDNHGLNSNETCEFYRIQHKESGLGFYTHFSEEDLSLNQLFPMNENIQVSPMEDEALKLVYKDRTTTEEFLGEVQFGFNSHEQIDKWLEGMKMTEDDLEDDWLVEKRKNKNFDFDSVQELLLKHNFEVVKFQASENDVIKTSRQIIYKPNNAKIIDRIDIKDYFKGLEQKHEYDKNIKELNQEDIDIVKTFLKNSNNSVTVKEQKRTKKNKQRNDNQLKLF